MRAYPGVLPILEVLLDDGAVDFGLIGLQTASISGWRADSPSMNSWCSVMRVRMTSRSSGRGSCSRSVNIWGKTKVLCGVT